MRTTCKSMRGVILGLPFALLLSTAANVGATNLHFLQYDPVSQLTTEDWELEGEAFLKAVSGPVNGQAVPWSNEETGSSGSITVLKSLPGPQGNPCRKIKETFQSRRMNSTYKLTVCQIGDDWKVVDANPNR